MVRKHNKKLLTKNKKTMLTKNKKTMFLRKKKKTSQTLQRLKRFRQRSRSISATTGRVVASWHTVKLTESLANQKLKLH